MKPKALLTTAAVLIAAFGGAPASPQNMLPTGLVIRAVTLPLTPGASGTPSGLSCDFSGEYTDQTGRMVRANVQCGAPLPQLLANLSPRFNAYCVADTSRLGGRVIRTPNRSNPTLCEFSAITPNDARARFGGAVWR